MGNARSANSGSINRMSEKPCPRWCSDHVDIDDHNPHAEPLHRSAPDELHVSGSDLNDPSTSVRLILEGRYTAQGFLDESADLNIGGHGIDLSAGELRALARMFERAADRLGAMP